MWKKKITHGSYWRVDAYITSQCRKPAERDEKKSKAHTHTQFYMYNEIEKTLEVNKKEKNP